MRKLLSSANKDFRLSAIPGDDSAACRRQAAASMAEADKERLRHLSQVDGAEGMSIAKITVKVIGHVVKNNKRGTAIEWDEIVYLEMPFLYEEIRPAVRGSSVLERSKTDSIFFVEDSMHIKKVELAEREV